MATDGKVRVVMAEDRGIVSEAFRLVLENAGIDVVARVPTGRQAVEKTLALKPDVVLLDITMPEMDGLAALAIITYHAPDTAAFILTAHPEERYIARAAELGAVGFFSKQVDPEALVEAIHAAAAASQTTDLGREEGHGKDSPAPKRAILWRETPMPQPDLTEQEEHVLTLLAEGWGNERIRTELAISLNTLKTHLKNLYAKIGVDNRTEAALWAVRQEREADE
jgi:DNA-binding NarL/FixJ family response regulator